MMTFAAAKGRSEAIPINQQPEVIIVKTLALITVAALFAIGSHSTVARAGSYDNDGDDYRNDDNSYSDDDSYSYHKHRHHYDCYWKKVKWYDDYGYKHYKRVKICS